MAERGERERERIFVAFLKQGAHNEAQSRTRRFNEQVAVVSTLVKFSSIREIAATLQKFIISTNQLVSFSFALPPFSLFRRPIKLHSR